MIELWRQCVTAVGSSVAGVGHDYLAVGALRAGGELREIRLVLCGYTSGNTQLYLGLSGVAAVGAGSFVAAMPLMQGPSVYRHLGKPGWKVGVSPYFPQMYVFPFAIKVESGSRWVHVALMRHATRVLSLIVTATVIGFAPEPVGGLDGVAGH